MAIRLSSPATRTPQEQDIDDERHAFPAEVVDHRKYAENAGRRSAHQTTGG